MQNKDLIQDYLKRAEVRLEAVALLFKRDSYADTVREAQEVVELSLKALLRFTAIEVPRIHDVSQILIENKSKFSKSIQKQIPKLAKISKSLRRDRELAFYGSEDLTPSSFYAKDDAEKALEDAIFVQKTCASAVK